MRHLLAPVVALALALAHAGRAAAQPQLGIERYRALVYEYQTGRGEQAIAALRNWLESDRRSLEITIVDLTRNRATDVATLRVLLASGMLHSDMAVEAESAGDTPAREFHFASAERLFTAADAFSRAGFLPRWHLAMGLHLLEETQIDVARVVLERACGAFPADARLQLACGMVTATYAALLRYMAGEESGRDHDSRREIAARRDAPMAQRQVSQRRELDLAAAARYLRNAIAADPTLGEARLRLAHAELLLGHDKNAAALLTDLARATHARELAYMNRMLLGRLAEQRGDSSAAAAEYRAAQAAVPGAQSALIALAHVLFVTGDRSASQAVIDRMLSVRPAPEDPWAIYPIRFLGTQAPSLHDLRREALK